MSNFQKTKKGQELTHPKQWMNGRKERRNRGNQRKKKTKAKQTDKTKQQIMNRSREEQKTRVGREKAKTNRRYEERRSWRGGKEDETEPNQLNEMKERGYRKGKNSK